MNDRPAGNLLVIDDEETICSAFARFFGRRGWAVRVAATAAEGLAALRQQRPDVVFLDIRLPDADGLEVLGQLRQADSTLPVVVITAYGGLSTVMASVAGRAFDYLPKPIDLDRAEQMADRAVEATAPRASAAGPAAAPAPAAERIVGSSPAMQEVFKRLAVVAGRDCSVLILGRTGTGKELVAREIHRHSARSAGPFVAVNGGALPESLVESELFGHVRGAFTGADRDRVGKFQAAEGGTLFLDEVGEIPPAAQVKLLRALDTRTIERVGSTEPIRLDVRVLAATNRDLLAEVQAGRFRADLYYRLAVVQIDLPPLAERREDILPLAEFFLAAAGREGSGGQSPRPGGPLCDAAAEALCAYPWPGNVRELRNAMQHVAAVAPGGAVRLEDLPDPIARHAADPPGDAPGQPGNQAPATGPPQDPALATPDSAAAADAAAERYLAELPLAEGLAHSQAIEPVERALIRWAMARCRNNQSEAAALLGLHRNTLGKRLRELGQ